MNLPGMTFMQCNDLSDCSHSIELNGQKIHLHESNSMYNAFAINVVNFAVISCEGELYSQHSTPRRSSFSLFYFRFWIDYNFRALISLLFRTLTLPGIKLARKQVVLIRGNWYIFFYALHCNSSKCAHYLLKY